MFEHAKDTALIGYTGFVGSNLKEQFQFSTLLNSQNIADAAGTQFDLLVSAAPSAVKWKANKFPEEDLAHINAYMDTLRTLSAAQVVMISTCDVYETPIEVDEDTPIEPTLETLHPYGKHRFMLEQFAREQFERVTVVRLPALFGEGLKKNIIYDLLHDNQVENIHCGGVFQFYNLSHLWHDIEIALENELPLLNITTEPVKVSEIARECFGIEFENMTDGTPARYDIRTKHPELFGGAGGYMYDKATVLTEIAKFVQSERDRL